MTRFRTGLPTAACLAALLLGARPAAAQAPQPPLSTPSWVGDATALGINALLGGLTGGLAQSARGGSFQDGFTRGALGGSVAYGGKRLAAQRFFGAGLLGREVAAVGASLVRNAAEGEGSLERILLPLGPVLLHLSPAGEERVRVKLDATSLVTTVYAATLRELEWDAAESLSAGAPVFRVRDLLLEGVDENSEIGAAGRTRAGVVFISDLAGLDFEENLAHERVHVLQHDQYFWTWTSPLEEALLERLPGGRVVGRYVDLNLSPLVTGVLGTAFKRYEHRPWELEAEYLARR